MVGRRRFVTGGLAAAVSVIIAPAGARAQTAYLTTAEMLQRSRASEVDAYRQYTAFTRQAKTDGYPGIAYLFTALGSAEFIHGQNFEKILVRLGAELTPLPVRQIQAANTHQNLIKAAADELDSVYTFYPGILKQLRPEGFQDAITMTNYAWESEKQHLDILKAIQQWSPNHFEAVAKKIEDETAQYFVCQNCGATTIKIPQEKCPICKLPSATFRKIAPPA